jgi:hypothetical protein
MHLSITHTSRGARAVYTVTALDPVVQRRLDRVVAAVESGTSVRSADGWCGLLGCGLPELRSIAALAGCTVVRCGRGVWGVVPE